MGKRKPKVEEEEKLERWLVSYADFITLMFAFFTVLYATAQADTKKLEEMVEAMNAAFSGSSLEALISSVGLRSANSPTNSYIPPNLEMSQRPDLSGLLSNNPMSIGNHSRSLTIDLPEKILFGNGSAELYPTSYAILGEIAETLASTPARLEITGHANAVPVLSASPFSDNLGLAAARALATVRYLESRGMPMDHMIAAATVCTDVWPDARAVTLRVKLDEWRLSGEILDRLQKTSLGEKWK